jgi:hypothetical protein
MSVFLDSISKIRIMRKAVIFELVMLAAFALDACQHLAQEQTVESERPSHQEDSTRVHSPSENHFILAEQHLAIREYHLAADQLHEGIIAFRSETGRVKGDEAAKINKVIWVLTRIRTRLKRGEAVKPEELHQAVANAISMHPIYHTRRVPSKKEPADGAMLMPVTDKKTGE